MGHRRVRLEGDLKEIHLPWDFLLSLVHVATTKTSGVRPLECIELLEIKVGAKRKIA